MDVLSIRELRQSVSTQPEPAEIHAQLEVILSKSAKSGKPFYELAFVDAEDRLVLRAWNDTPAFQQASSMRPGIFVRVTGDWFLNDPFGIEAKNWNIDLLPDEEAGNLLSGSEELRQKQEADYATIELLVSEMADPRLRGICQAFLEKFGDRFKRTGAARNYHHARRGGLVEHVAQMMRTAVVMAGVYPDLNGDLIIAGVLFHDCGKLWENVYGENDFTMPYSDRGELLGHIPMGMEIVNKLWRDLMETEEAQSWLALEPPSEQVRLHLLHMIGSHHGSYEFGAPVLPKTPEAVMLHHIDNIDAKMEMFDKGYPVAAQLSQNVFERVRPLPANMVRPLAKFELQDEEE